MIAQRDLVEADLEACEREPIHVPGHIQPHGFLLAAPETGGGIEYASENVPELLLRPLETVFGRSWEDVLGATVNEKLQLAIADDQFSRRPIHLLSCTLPESEREFTLIGHRYAGRIIVEGEIAVPTRNALPDSQSLLEEFLAQIDSTAELIEMLDLAARELRRITDFDRVLVYQFDRDWNGTVVAENRNDVLPSYLDLRFPAADIPRQARELYRINRMRLIVTADYTPVRLIHRASADVPIDLTLSTLRSVSPLHLEYMRNMGTGSSMSISLLRGGELWGLISCHSRKPHVVPFAIRATCNLLGQMVSLQLAAREQAQALEYRVRLRGMLTEILQVLSRHESITDALDAVGDRLLQVVAASGSAVLLNGQIVLRGRTPGEGDVRALVRWLTENERGDVFHTEMLANEYPAAEAFAEVASGLVAVSLSRVQESFVLWFRPEVVQTVKWGGEPEKGQADNNPAPKRLHPRRSFETWKQILRGRSTPWQSAEIEAAVEFRTALVEIVLKRAEKLAQVTEELTRTNKELEAFSYTVSHDLRAPFRHIRGYAELMQLDKSEMLDDEGREFLKCILDGTYYAGTLVDNILNFSQMGRTSLRPSLLSVAELVHDVQRDLAQGLTGRQIQWVIGALPKVHADPAMLRIVLQNLIENAVKYSRGREISRIEIGAQETETEHVVFVRDNGVGFQMEYVDKLFGIFQRLHRVEEFEGTGIGLASVRRIISRHGGRTWAESKIGEGATFFFSLPKTPAVLSSHVQAHPARRG